VRWVPETALEIHPHEYVALKNYIAELFDGPIDVLSREGLKPHVRPATTDAIYAFSRRDPHPAEHGAAMRLSRVQGGFW
jgi:hypothetical protein